MKENGRCVFNVSILFFFFFDNHGEYIKKAIKPIAKEKYKGYEKKKKN